MSSVPEESVACALDRLSLALLSFAAGEEMAGYSTGGYDSDAALNTNVIETLLGIVEELAERSSQLGKAKDGLDNGTCWSSSRTSSGGTSSGGCSGSCSTTLVTASDSSEMATGFDARLAAVLLKCSLQLPPAASSDGIGIVGVLEGGGGAGHGDGLAVRPETEMEFERILSEVDSKRRGQLRNVRELIMFLQNESQQ